MYLLLWVVWVASASGAEREIEDFVELDLEELLNTVFTAAKHEQDIGESPSAITLITRKDIRASGATTLPDLLRRVPGFDIYELKPSYPLVGARALTEESNNLVLVLIDGREVNVELSGFPLWNGICIDLDEIERIEVIRGPGSALYGANAFAAVVNIITIRSESLGTGGDVYVSGGQQSHLRLSGRVRGSFDLQNGTISFKATVGAWEVGSPSGNLDEALSLGRAHGVLRFRQGHRLDLSLHAGFTMGDGWLYVHLGDMHVSDATNPWVMGQADVVIGESLRLKAQVYHVRYKTTFHWRLPLRAYNIWIADVQDFLWDSPTLDMQLQVDWQVLDSLLIIGGTNIRYTTLTSPQLILVDDDELRGAGFVHIQWDPWEMLQITGGLRLDLNTDTRAALSPRVAAVAHPWPNHYFRLGYGLAFRKPSHYENRWHPKIARYNPAVPEIVDKSLEMVGNEDLRNEVVHSFGAGWRGAFVDKKLQVTADLFFNLYLNTISFVIDLPLRLGLPDILNSTLRFENADTRVRAFGGEIEVSWNGFDEWFFWGNLGYRHVINQDQEERILAEPLIITNLGVRYLPPDGLFADVAIHYTSQRKIPMLDPGNLLNPPQPFALGDQMLLIGRLGYRFLLGGRRKLECGLISRTPLGAPFREWPGMPLADDLSTSTLQDFGGEQIVHRVSLYLRSSF